MSQRSMLPRFRIHSQNRAMVPACGGARTNHEGLRGEALRDLGITHETNRLPGAAHRQTVHRGRDKLSRRVSGANGRECGNTPLFS
jgi:hypothetical protein